MSTPARVVLSRQLRGDLVSCRCGRIATHRQERVHADGLSLSTTFSCGTHRLPADHEALLHTDVRLEGFTQRPVSTIVAEIRARLAAGRRLTAVSS